MRIDVYEILTTNSLSGSRIIINDNFRMLAEGLNNLYGNIDIDDDGNMSLSKIKSINGEKADIQKANIAEFLNKTKTCMKFDEKTGHLLILDENGDLTLDVNKFIIDSKSGKEESEEERLSRDLMEQVSSRVPTRPPNGTVTIEYE